MKRSWYYSVVCGLCSFPGGSFRRCCVESTEPLRHIVELRSSSAKMVQKKLVPKKRKQKTPEEPNNKKVAKLVSEDEGGNEDATQKITVEVLPKEIEKQEVKKEDVDTKEPKKAEGNGSQSSGKKKKKKIVKKVSKVPKKSETESNEPKKSETKSTEPKKSETKPTEPRKSESESNEPKKSETESTEPKKSETESTEPKKSETESNEPKKSKTESNEPKKSKTESNEPKKRKTADPDYVLSKEDAEKLLGAFSKDELADIVKSALKKYGDIANDIADIARKDPAKRKLFVRGLGWETTPETLNSVFSAYGEIEKADVVMDRSSGKSKGFGFVTFESFAGVMAALKEPSKKIDDRMTVCQLSIGAPPQDSQQIAGRKIYVGGLPKEEVDSDKLLKFFSQYGEIEEGPLGFDKDTGKSKGYAFFIYKSERSAKSALEEPTKTFDGVTLTCKTPDNSKNATPSKSGQVNMWPYGSPLGGYMPMGNFGSPLLQQAFLRNR